MALHLVPGGSKHSIPCGQATFMNIPNLALTAQTRKLAVDALQQPKSRRGAEEAEASEAAESAQHGE